MSRSNAAVRRLTIERSRLPAIARSPALIVALLGLFALLPRVWGLADFATTDEAYTWITRTERFSAAIARGRWSETAPMGHPGVTIMWLGSLGLLLERFVTANGWASVQSTIEHLAWLRLPSALLQAALVPAAYLLLRRLVQPITALIAAVLWMASPYLIAHARLLHLDALLTSFVTFSLLWLIVAIDGDRTQPETSRLRHFFVGRLPSVELPALLASGVCAGLALLTKGPALILLPYVAVWLLWRSPPGRFSSRLRHVVCCYLIWLGIAVLVIVALWPALWSAPRHAYEMYRDEIIWNGGRPNGDGQFFLGRAVDDPGLLFYIVADLFRTTPATLLGLLVLGFWGIWTRWRDRSAQRCAQDHDERAILERRTLLALGLFALFWTLVMTLGPKKFDRYALPTWPALLVLSAAGWRLLFELLQRVHYQLSTRTTAGASMPSRRAMAALLHPFIWAGALLFLAVSQQIAYHPYYLSYYNPLLGGGPVAQRLFLIGWGEGMDQVGAFLRTRHDIGYGPVLSALEPTLQPFVPVPVKRIDEFGMAPANYAVVYLESIQRAANPPLYASIQSTVPLARITIHGIDYAWIHQLPKPFERATPARFGEGLYLRGVTLKRSADQLVVTPSWDVRADLPSDYLLFLHLLDNSGRRIAQIDVAPNGAEGPPTSGWLPGEQIAVPLPLPLPQNLPAGDYRLVMGLYDARSGERLPLREGPTVPAEQAGPHALLLDTLRFP